MTDNNGNNAGGLVTEKLYSPLEFYLHNPREEEDNGEYGLYDLYDERYQIPHYEAFDYMDAIELAFRRDRDRMDPARGMAEYVPESLDDLVVSFYPRIELDVGKLCCVADIALSRPITPGEMGELKQWWSGQLSDGWGEGFEQHEIRVGREEIYVVPWSSGDDFFIDTRQAFAQRLGIDIPAAEIYQATPEVPEFHQPATEPPAQAAQHEPDAFANDSATAAATDAMREQLIGRLNTNLTEYVRSLHDYSATEIAGASSEISAMAGAHHYLTEMHDFRNSEPEYLLKFQNPLQVVADQFALEADIEDHSAVMRDIFDSQSALRGDYALAADTPEHPSIASKENVREKETVEKPSVLAHIRKAREEEKANPAPRKESPGKDLEPEF